MNKYKLISSITLCTKNPIKNININIKLSKKTVQILRLKNLLIAQCIWSLPGSNIFFLLINLEIVVAKNSQTTKAKIQMIIY